MAKTIGESPELLAALQQLTGMPNDEVARVVIDIRAGHPPKVYVDRWVDEKHLTTVVEAMTEVQIERG